jgi:hypothetical protein
MLKALPGEDRVAIRARVLAAAETFATADGSACFPATVTGATARPTPRG